MSTDLAEPVSDKKIERFARLILWDVSSQFIVNEWVWPQREAALDEQEGSDLKFIETGELYAFYNGNTLRRIRPDLEFEWTWEYQIPFG